MGLEDFFFCLCFSSLAYLGLFILALMCFFPVLQTPIVDKKEKGSEWEGGGSIAASRLNSAGLPLIIFTFDGELSQISSTSLRF